VAPSRSYDPKATYIFTLLNLSKSVVPKVATRLDFWLFLLCHVTAWASNQAGYFGTVVSNPMLHYLQIKESHVNYVFWITSLITVFALNQSYLRYLELAGLSSKMMGCVYDYCYEARLFLRRDGPYDRLACRWLAVSVLLTFCEAKQNCGGHGVTEEEWRKLVDLNLVRPDEQDFLQQLNPKQRLLVMMHTAADLSKQGLEEATKTLGGTELTHRLLECKNLQQQLLDTTAAKISFEYFHLLCMLLISSMLFLGYSMSLELSFFAPPTFLITLFILFGTMELMTVLNEPFADGNEADFPVNVWAHEFMQNLSALLDYEHGGASDNWAHELNDEYRSQTRMHLDLTDINSILYAGSRVMQVASTTPRSVDLRTSARTASAPPPDTATKVGPAIQDQSQMQDGQEQTTFGASLASAQLAMANAHAQAQAQVSSSLSQGGIGDSWSAGFSSLTGNTPSANRPDLKFDRSKRMCS